MSKRVEKLKKMGIWDFTPKDTRNNLSCYSTGVYFLIDEDRFVRVSTGSTRDTMYDMEVENIKFKEGARIIKKRGRQW